MSRSTNTNQPEVISGLATLCISPMYASGQKLFSGSWLDSATPTIDSIDGTIIVSQDPHLMVDADIGDGFILHTKISQSGADTQDQDVYKLTKSLKWAPIENDQVTVERSSTGYPEGLIFRPGASTFVRGRDEPYPLDAVYTVFKSNEMVTMTISGQRVTGTEIWVKSDGPLPDGELITKEVKLFGTVQAGDA